MYMCYLPLVAINVMNLQIIYPRYRPTGTASRSWGVNSGGGKRAQSSTLPLQAPTIREIICKIQAKSSLVDLIWPLSWTNCSLRSGRAGLQSGRSFCCQNFAHMPSGWLHTCVFTQFSILHLASN